MFSMTERRSGGVGGMGARLRVAGLVGVVAAALVALVSPTADAASMYVQSARSGELAGGRLTLHGVGRNVTWTTSGGRVGVVRITRAHKRLFSPETPATGTLHIAGQRGGDELAFRLSKPRYNAARATVSYRAKPLAKRTVAASAARSFAAAGGARRFGPASLSVVPHSAVAGGDNGGNDCQAGFGNYTWYGMANVSSSKWNTDTWESPSARFLQPGYTIGNHNSVGVNSQFDDALWESDGGLWEGCANHTTWTLAVDPNDPGGSGTPPANVTFDFNLEWDWTKLPVFSCSTSDTRFTCDFDNVSQRWNIYDSQRPPDPGAS
jgi:hypothetical protein